MASLHPSVLISQQFNMNNTRSLKLNGIQPSLIESFTWVFPTETCQNIFYNRGSVGQKHNFLQNAKTLQTRCKQSYPADLLPLHSDGNKQTIFMKYVLVFNQHRGLKDFWSSFMREETRAGGAGSQRAATPCRWFIRHAKICFTLWDQPWETPHALWLTPFLLCFLFSSTITHTASLKNIPSAVEERHNTVLFPPLHMW